MDGFQPFHSFLLSLRSLSPFCFTTTFLLERDNIKRLPAQTHLRAGSIFIFATIGTPLRHQRDQIELRGGQATSRRSCVADRGAARGRRSSSVREVCRGSRCCPSRAHRGHLAQDQDHFRHHRRGWRAGARPGRAGTLYRDLNDLLLNQIGAVTPKRLTPLARFEHYNYKSCCLIFELWFADDVLELCTSSNPSI